MRRFAHYSLRLLVAVALGALVAGCDESPTSVQDFDIQADVRPSTSDVVFFAGQSPNPSFEVTYQGLDEHPVAESSGDLQLNQVTQTGSPDRGEQVYELSFPREVNGNSESALVQITSVRDGEQLVDSIEVQINNPISVTEDFAPRLAAAQDFEDSLRTTETTGGATVTATRDVSPNSNGQNAVEVSMGTGGQVTFQREANLGDFRVLTFLIRPDPNTDFSLTATLTEAVDGGTASYDIDVTVPSGSAWRQYTIAAGQLFANFDPVAERAGGSGPLQSVSFTVDQDNVSFGLDEIAFGNAEAPAIEIEDFEVTDNRYFRFGNVDAAYTENVAPLSDGPLGRRLSYSAEGNDNSFFGYNYTSNNSGESLNLRLDPSSDAVLSMRVSDVSKAFDLYAFIETNDGSFTSGSGTAVPLEAGADPTLIDIPLGNIVAEGGDLAAVFESEIFNVGFEIQRKSDDDTSDPIEFTLDDVKLRAASIGN